MEYLRNIAHRISDLAYDWILEDENVDDDKTRSRINAYLNHVYKILLWEDPKNSWTAFGLVHVLFWYATIRLVVVCIFNTLALAGSWLTFNPVCWGSPLSSP